MRQARFAAVLAASAFLFSACQSPKYVTYTSIEGDFSCDIPFDWQVVREHDPGAFSNVVFTGPHQAEFFRGLPSLQIRWYRNYSQHLLPDGTYESYTGPHDFVRQLMKDVYGKRAYMRSGSDQEQAEALKRNEYLPESRLIKMAGREAVYFVVYNTIPAPKGLTYGVVSNDKGQRIVRQRHAYAILPVKGGFYVLTYPATVDGFEMFRPSFFRMINSFKLYKEGPYGPAAKPQR